MPGVFKLEQELGVNHGVVHRALGLLERQGILENQGRGKKRRIVMGNAQPATLNIKVLLYERADLKNDYLLELIHLLGEEGHSASFADKSMVELGMKVGRISRFVNSTGADAWVVVAGPNDVLRWFSQQPAPAFALFGFNDGALPCAAPKKIPAIGELLEHLLELGHRRIVHVAREEHRKPKLGAVEQFILKELEKRGIATGPYNIPDWGNSPADLQDMLDSVFRHTPPTALLLDEAPIFMAAKDHLARKGICCPKHVSLACYDPDPGFDWFLPPVTHITWNPRPIIRAVVRWVGRVSEGQDDRRITMVKSQLVVGGTIGPPPKG